MKITNNFHYKRKPSFTTPKLILFAVSKDEWDTNEECIVRTAVCQKALATPNSKKTKPIALAIHIS